MISKQFESAKYFRYKCGYRYFVSNTDIKLHSVTQPLLTAAEVTLGDGLN